MHGGDPVCQLSTYYSISLVSLALSVRIGDIPQPSASFDSSLTSLSLSQSAFPEHCGIVLEISPGFEVGMFVINQKVDLLELNILGKGKGP